MGELKYEIKGTVHQVAEIHLDQGQRVFSETGGMIWMDPSVEMDTAMPGTQKGFLGALGGALQRAVAGESLFLNYFTAKSGAGRVAFASSFLGNIIPIALAAGQSIIAQRGAFLVGQDGVEIKVEFTRKIGVGFLGGEGFILQRLTGPGMIFLEIDGEVTMIELAAGQQVKVDTGHLAAFEDTVKYDIEIQKNIKNMLLSGEGFALAIMTGPGKVWLQNQTIQGLAGLLKPFFPVRSS